MGRKIAPQSDPSYIPQLKKGDFLDFLPGKLQDLKLLGRR